MPRVSVLMLTFNRPQLIGRAIESIIGQTFQDWELIVVHDGTDERIAAILRGWEMKETRIRYFRRKEPGNIAEATNFGLSKAKGEYIAILDDDDRWATPVKLAKQVAFLDRNPDHVVCGGGVIVVDQDGAESMRYLKPEKNREIIKRALIANPMAHSTTMFRKQAVEACGGYDNQLAGFQDWDLWLKLGRLGKLYNFPEYFLEYTIWQGGGSFQQSRKNTRSALTIVWRHRGAYGGFPLALLIALLYHAYAHAPVFVKKYSYAFLSRLKKSLFSKSTAASPAGTPY